ncbi:MAG: FtsB family cell division protein [Rubrobacter sp.]|nr:septum formation initiator family protein [Rubrobacteraceae bacterium]MDQ3251502.1 septum formation initiator family protein [Actinomycetota bacterium]MDQ3436495.1 septum formation initiator family protein [Actinomycetota bacterium]
MSVPRRLKPLVVVIYAAFLGLLLASYVPPLQDILHNRAEIPTLEQRLQETRTQNTTNERLIEELQTPAGIERAARERYGMVRPGEKVYIIPSE